MPRFLLSVAAVVLLSGCYHAQVVTSELKPSTVVVEDTFADAWIYGLVPPKEIDVSDKCTSGVAKVETRLSFVNQLVGALTFGIYTPMHIRVTCGEK
ncbi:MAG: Bor family protein [Rhodothermia bacterium]|nr:Bor family protein [Rhodothermia bacterium]